MINSLSNLYSVSQSLRRRKELRPCAAIKQGAVICSDPSFQFKSNAEDPFILNQNPNPDEQGCSFTQLALRTITNDSNQIQIQTSINVN